MKRALLLLAAAALLAWLLWPQGDAQRSAPAADAPPAPAAPPPQLMVRGELLPAAEPPKTEDAAKPTIAGAPSAGPWLDGRIEVAKRDGTRHAEENGAIRLHLTTAQDYDYTEPLRVPVRGGRFRLRLGEATRMIVHHITLRDRPAVLRGIEEDGAVAIGDARLLRAVWHAVTVLDIVDAATRRPLKDVEAAFVEAPSYLLGLRHLGPDEGQFFRGDSPLDVPGVTAIHAASARAALVVVRAKGYGFRRVMLDIERGGRREVRLEPGGTLRLTVKRPRGRDRYSVRLSMPRDLGKAEDHSSTLYGGDLRPGPGTLEVPNLPAGLWRVEVVRNGRLAVRGRVRIEPGATSELTLAVPPKPRPTKKKPKVPLTLDIEVEEGWAPESLTVYVGRMNSRPHVRKLTKLTPTGGRTWRWTLDIPDEQLFATIAPTGVVQRVHDPREPGASTKLRVPAPAVVTVSCAWKDGTAAAPQNVRWSGTDRLPKAPWPAGGIAKRLPDGRFQFLCVPMQIRVRAYRPQGGFSASALELRPQSGSHEVALEFERLCAVRFELYDGETRVPWHVGMDDRNKAEPLFDTAREQFDFDGATGTLLLDRPGRWRFTLHPGPDFHPPAPVELELQRGDNGVQRVAVRRK